MTFVNDEMTVVGQAADPLAYGAVALVPGLVALGACYIPARRAAGVDPMAALRQE